MRSSQMSVDLLASGTHLELQSQFPIRQACASVDHIAVLGAGNQVAVYEITTPGSSIKEQSIPKSHIFIFDALGA